MTSSEYDEYLIAKKDAMGEFGRFAGFNECTSKVLIKFYLIAKCILSLQVAAVVLPENYH